MPPDNLLSFVGQFPFFTKPQTDFCMVGTDNLVFGLFQGDAIAPAKIECFGELIMKKLLKYDFSYIVEQSADMKRVGLIFFVEVFFGTAIQNICCYSR